MVSFNVYRATSSGAYVEGVCLASDEKPITGIANGSILFAVDPSDGSTTRYMFDQSTASWIEAECPCSGGGEGGGGSGGDVFVVGLSELPDGAVLDKNWTEINAAMAAGKVCIAVQGDEMNGSMSCPIVLCAQAQSAYNVAMLMYNTMAGAVDGVVFTSDSATGTLTAGSGGGGPS